MPETGMIQPCNSIKRLSITFVLSLTALMSVNNQVVMGQADQWEHDARLAIEQNIQAFNAHDRRAYWCAYNYQLISVAPDRKIAARATTAEDVGS